MNSRVISKQDLTTGGFEELAEEWDVSKSSNDRSLSLPPGFPWDRSQLDVDVEVRFGRIRRCDDDFDITAFATSISRSCSGIRSGPSTPRT